MVKRSTVIGLAGLAAFAILSSGGCGPSTDLTGSPIPNSVPDTRVTSRPPELLETGFVVRFFWTGSDPDGRIQGYHWKISNNGTDGISVLDTLTFDPATGDTLNPWRYTATTDSTFFVSADIPDFPSDPEGYDRSYQSHTFLVRSIDEDGAVDPTPALVSFNSTTLLPTVQVVGPGAIVNQREAQGLPKMVRILFEGEDPDADSRLPTRVRFLWKPAILPSGAYAAAEGHFVGANLDYLVSFDDPDWTDWQAYDPDDDTRRFSQGGNESFDGDGDRIFYLFAVQVMDTAGAVSIGRTYARQVSNVSIVELAPTLHLVEPYIAEKTGSGLHVDLQMSHIAGGRELNVSWLADASSYAGRVVSYRYGWDIADVEDASDPNWAVPPANTPQNRRAPTISFSSGIHVLTVEVLDDSDQITRGRVPVTVVPIPDPANQFPLLLVDDVNDINSASWEGEQGQLYDRDAYRDDFWNAALGAPGGVSDWDSTGQTIDARVDVSSITYQEAVKYKAIVWYSRWTPGVLGAVAKYFRPLFGDQLTPDEDRHIWLAEYQKNAGNLLLAGPRAMLNFLTESAFELPVVFEERDGAWSTGYRVINGTPVRTGFGNRLLPDGTTVRVGPLRYPFKTMGVSLVDIMSHSTYYEYGTAQKVTSRRKATCVGLKGLRVDDTFRAEFLPGGADFSDVILTNTNVDWADNPMPLDDDVLSFVYSWGSDEFYNADAVGRNTNWTEQAGAPFGCGDGASDMTTLCLVPMFRSISRFDWVQMERQELDPDDTWPHGYYGGQGQGDITALCGPAALKVGNNDAITNDRPVAFISRKNALEKPSQAGDVVFGFDPYRFDNDEMYEVVRWVLGQHFGLTMTPH